MNRNWVLGAMERWQELKEGGPPTRCEFGSREFDQKGQRLAENPTRNVCTAPFPEYFCTPDFQLLFSNHGLYDHAAGCLMITKSVHEQLQRRTED